MRRTSLGSIFLLLLSCAAAAPASAETAPPQFDFSDLPPANAKPVPAKPPTTSLYDVFATGETSPLGTAVSSVKPEDFFDQASSFLRASNGRPANPTEAAFWLKHAITLGPDESGERRSWALLRLGGLLYASGPIGHGTARTLWELAGALSNPEALCALGALAETGDDVAKPDPKEARIWYERAKKAGCSKADDALSRLPG